MKSIATFLFLTAITFSICSCNDNKKNTTTENLKTENKQTPQKSIETTSSTIPSKYSTVFGLIDTSADFSIEKGTYKIISKDPIHIQISSKVVEGDSKKVIIGLTKKDFVYVVFDAFARTNINKIRITSIPLTTLNNSEVKEAYLVDYKVSATVTREKAKSIMQKYIKTSNFDDLMGGELNGKKEMFISSPLFDQLKSLDNDFVIHVFDDLTTK